MKASMLDATAIRPRVWTKLLMVVAVAPAPTLDDATARAPTEEITRMLPPPDPPPPPRPTPAPRQLPTGSPACGNVTSRAPAPRACEAPVDDADEHRAPPPERATGDDCARPRVLASGAPACGNVTARPLPGRASGRRR